MSVLSGEETSIQFKTILRSRLEKPYGKCTTNFPNNYNSTDYNLNPVKKTFLSCTASCLQQKIYDECNCTDPNFPIYKNSIVNERFCQAVPVDRTLLEKFFKEVSKKKLK